MKRIGLTGNIGTGKSTVARIFGILGVPVYHADIQARVLLNSEAAINQIVSVFGKQVVTMNHKVDRKVLAEIVFNDKVKLDALNNIIHPLVEADFAGWCNFHKNAPYVLHEAAILFESGFDRLFDAIVLVTAPEEVCLSRVIIRDGVTAEMVKARMQNQWPQQKKIDLADYIIVNDDHSMIIPQVLSIHNKLIQ